MMLSLEQISLSLFIFIILKLTSDCSIIGKVNCSSYRCVTLRFSSLALDSIFPMASHDAVPINFELKLCMILWYFGFKHNHCGMKALAVTKVDVFR